MDARRGSRGTETILTINKNVSMKSFTEHKKRRKAKDKKARTFALYGKYTHKATRIRERHREARRLRNLGAHAGPSTVRSADGASAKELSPPRRDVGRRRPRKLQLR